MLPAPGLAGLILAQHHQLTTKRPPPGARRARSDQLGWGWAIIPAL